MSNYIYKHVTLQKKIEELSLEIPTDPYDVQVLVFMQHHLDPTLQL